jgi:hypothetical protein
MPLDRQRNEVVELAHQPTVRSRNPWWKVERVKGVTVDDRSGFTPSATSCTTRFVALVQRALSGRHSTIFSNALGVCRSSRLRISSPRSPYARGVGVERRVAPRAAASGAQTFISISARRADSRATASSRASKVTGAR